MLPQGAPRTTQRTTQQGERNMSLGIMHLSQKFHPQAPGRCTSNFKQGMFKHILETDILNVSSTMALR